LRAAEKMANFGITPLDPIIMVCGLVFLGVADARSHRLFRDRAPQAPY
jgi:hypothetical protein